MIQLAGPAMAAAAFAAKAEPALDVRSFGAAGDGRADDTAAINHAIATAAAAGSGIVRFPAGTYRSYSIRLKNFTTLYLDEGATILAANTPHGGITSGGYDTAELNVPWDAYQDFGHSHWHNSLIWGENVRDITILGPGRIWGHGLSRGFNEPDMPLAEAPGVGNKTIALKNCRHVTLRDFSILSGGHFGIPATGVDNLTIDNLTIDTNRDGIDIDCCCNVQISDTHVNAPWDDAIALKSSFALGYAKMTENITITNCSVTGGYQVGSLLDRTFKPIPAGWWPPVGRIKCGTESNGGFRNIIVANCFLQTCRGLALASVDGGVLEDITVTGLTMRDIRDAPFYLRLGARLRGPGGIPIGSFRRVSISNVTCSAPHNPMPAVISGIPGYPVEDIKIDNTELLQEGGGTNPMAAVQPPELERGYPDPSQLGPLPAQHFFIRHARNIEFGNIRLESVEADARPVFWLDEVAKFDAFHLQFRRSLGAPAFLLNDVTDFRVFASGGVVDTSFTSISHGTI